MPVLRRGRTGMASSQGRERLLSLAVVVRDVPGTAFVRVHVLGGGLVQGGAVTARPRLRELPRDVVVHARDLGGDVRLVAVAVAVRTGGMALLGAAGDDHIAAA